MDAEVVTARPGDAMPQPRAPLEALTLRASLNAVAGLVDYTAKIVVTLVVTPILVSGLGRALYGVWEMLTRLGLSFTAVDGRPTGALRLVIAQHQADGDDVAKRRLVGAALLVYVLVLPLLAAGAAAVAWWVAPALADAPPPLVGTVRVAAALALAAFLLTGLSALPEAVLRGMNLGYRRMGVQAGLNVLSGVLAAGAIGMGFGLVGVAGAQLVFAIASGVCFWLLARRFVQWLGIAKPRREDVRTLFGIGIWLAAGDAVAKIMLSSDVLILGTVMAPALVTTYVLTGYAARMAQGVHVFVATAAIPGVGGLLGHGEWSRAAQARRELHLLTWLFATVIGATILLANRTFVALWVGPANYAGVMVDVLIVLLAVQTLFIRVDAYIIDAALRPRLRVLIGLVAMLLSVVLAIVLTRAYGIAGLCTGLLVGRLVQSVAYPVLARRHLQAAVGEGILRRLVAMVALFALAATLGSRLAVDGWLAWAGLTASGGIGAAGLTVILGLDEGERGILRARLRALRNGWGQR